MSRKVEFPSLLKYASIKTFRAENPDMRFSDSSYFRERRQQQYAEKLKAKVEQDRHRSIVQGEIQATIKDDKAKQEEQLREMVALVGQQKLKVSELLPVKDAIALSQRAISSIRLSMISNWQAAAWWLERVHPDIFAKREAATTAANIIGIRLEVHQRQRSLSKKDDITRLSVPDVKIIKQIKQGKVPV